jgi:hypothetical protein
MSVFLIEETLEEIFSKALVGLEAWFTSFSCSTFGKLACHRPHPPEQENSY